MVLFGDSPSYCDGAEQFDFQIVAAVSRSAIERLYIWSPRTESNREPSD
jgi:hypothetical protein